MKWTMNYVVCVVQQQNKPYYGLKGGLQQWNTQDFLRDHAELSREEIESVAVPGKQQLQYSYYTEQCTGHYVPQ